LARFGAELAAKERQVKLTNELDAARKRISKALHLDAWMGVLMLLERMMAALAGMVMAFEGL
jgi:hypothetical protein